MIFPQPNDALIRLSTISIDMAEQLVKHANNPNIAARLTDKFPHPYTLQDAYSFIQFANSFETQEIAAILFNNEMIGTIGVHPQQDVYRKNAEMGYWIGETYWGKGFIALVIPAMVDYAFQTWDINRIFARPFGFNTPSQRVLEKCGFVLEAKISEAFYKNGIYHDELIYALRRQDWQEHNTQSNSLET